MKKVIGEEYDDEKFRKLVGVLKNMKAKLLSEEYGIGGSQELSTYVFSIGTVKVEIVKETYIGLSIESEDTMVETILRNMNYGELR